jgi:hypothetical protein
MGLFDKIKDAASDLVDGAKDKVGEVTGIDADSLNEAGGSIADAGESVSEAMSSIEDGKLGA